MLEVCEIFKSIQGESTRAGLLCAFVRLSGCNLECVWCDTRYARAVDRSMPVEEVVASIDKLACPLVEITGGEPLLQAETPQLCAGLIAVGHTVLIETNGSLDIAALPPGCIRIVDVKCPDSGAGGSFRMANLAELTPVDECKLVIASRRDFDWALAFTAENYLDKRCSVIFSPATTSVSPRELAEWIIAANAPVRLGLQLHALIWGKEARGR
jgi:7-carboxy-7-deazaguanine synthase